MRYIIAIQELKQKGEEIRCVSIARHLNVSRSSVSKMLRCMAESGLVYTNFCNSVEFTEDGIKCVDEIFQNYNEIFTFFHKYLKLPSDVSKEHTIKFIVEFPKSTCDNLKNLIENSVNKKNPKNSKVENNS